MKFKKGDYILVNSSFTDKNKEFRNFGGRIQQIYKNGIIKVVWDSISLKTYTDEFIKMMLENDYYLFDYNFSENEIELAEPRDTLDEMYEMQEKIYNRKLRLLKKEISKIEEYYDRFVLSSFYEKLTDTQKNKSWDIINIFSTIMFREYSQLPDEWTVSDFESAYTNEFQINVYASKKFYSSSKQVLLNFVKFLQYKEYCQTLEIQKFLSKY